MTYFKYQVCLCGKGTKTYLKPILLAVTEQTLQYLKCYAQPQQTFHLLLQAALPHFVRYSITFTISEENFSLV